MRINQNIAAFNAYRNLNVTNDQMNKSLEKLSSGFRINRAADDASGLVRSEGLRAEIGGTKQAIRNAQDGISFVQTAEGALNEVHTILQRIRDLAVSAANSTSDGAAEQAEVDELVAELSAIGGRTTFAGGSVFGNYSVAADPGDPGDPAATPPVPATPPTASTAKVFHVGAGNGTANQLSITADLRIDTGSATNGFLGVDLGAIDLTTGADAAIATLDTAIANTSTVRSELGATQNRLESAVRNLSVAAENLSAAESRIRDTDMAEEMVSFTRSQILQQAGTAMLAQANQVPQTVLSLLR
ncbi:MAG TPA: flagellin [Egibacteraceae bacterium]|jgi:flagellin|nr:flagellin [Egibacteraceae bacterium]